MLKTISQAKERSLRKEFINFLDCFCLYLTAGYDPAQSWKETFNALEKDLSDRMKAMIVLPESEGIGHLLDALAKTFPLENHRLWFKVLFDFYRNGTGMERATEAFCTQLRKEHQRELESHSRSLPTRINICLLIFFLPSVFLLLFAPLLVALTH